MTSQIDGLKEDLSSEKRRFEELSASNATLRSQLQAAEQKLQQQDLELQRSKGVEVRRSRELLKAQEDLAKAGEELTSSKRSLDVAHGELERARANAAQSQRQVFNLEQPGILF